MVLGKTWHYSSGGFMGTPEEREIEGLIETGTAESLGKAAGLIEEHRTWNKLAGLLHKAVSLGVLEDQGTRVAITNTVFSYLDATVRFAVIDGTEIASAAHMKIERGGSDSEGILDMMKEVKNPLANNVRLDALKMLVEARRENRTVKRIMAAQRKREKVRQTRAIKQAR